MFCGYQIFYTKRKFPDLKYNLNLQIFIACQSFNMYMYMSIFLSCLLLEDQPAVL